MFSRNVNGNLVGTDGFIVPRNFNEFADRYPQILTRHSEGEIKLLRGGDRIAAFESIASRGISAERFFNYIWHVLAGSVREAQ
jgi:hypothetical protein